MKETHWNDSHSFLSLRCFGCHFEAKSVPCDVNIKESYSGHNFCPISFRSALDHDAVFIHFVSNDDN